MRLWLASSIIVLGLLGSTATWAADGASCPFQGLSTAEELCASWEQIWPQVEKTSAVQGDPDVCGYLDRVATLYRLTPGTLLPTQNLRHMAVRSAALQALETPEAAHQVRDLGIEHTRVRGEIYAGMIQGTIRTFAAIGSIGSRAAPIGRNFNAEVVRVRTAYGCAPRS